MGGILYEVRCCIFSFEVVVLGANLAVCKKRGVVISLQVDYGPAYSKYEPSKAGIIRHGLDEEIARYLLDAGGALLHDMKW